MGAAARVIGVTGEDSENLPLLMGCDRHAVSEYLAGCRDIVWLMLSLIFVQMHSGNIFPYSRISSVHPVSHLSVNTQVRIRQATQACDRVMMFSRQDTNSRCKLC